MNRTKIDWPGLTHTWNPVVGCSRDCSYCYARRMNDRFKWIPNWKYPQYFPARLYEPLDRKKPSTIFVGSMSDIQYWKATWMLRVLDVCKSAEQHKFMFLTKSPGVYINFDFPPNCMLGLTLTGKESESEIQGKYNDLTNPNITNSVFLSIEPILGKFPLMCNDHRLELVVVGGQTGPGAVPVKEEWVASVLDNFQSKVHLKKGMKYEDSGEDE